jgi:hypothetical protein
MARLSVLIGQCSKMIRCYVDKTQNALDEQLPLILAAYRSTPHKATGISPNAMMLGREVHQASDLCYRDPETIRETLDMSKYLERLQNALGTAHDVARKSLQQAQRKQKRLYDMCVFDRQYDVGDLVYANKLSRKKGMSPKLQPVWEGPFIVLRNSGPFCMRYRGKGNLV